MAADAVTELHPRERELDRTIAFVALGLRALGERAYQWATLLLAAGIWGGVLFVAMPTAPRLIGATIFTILIHLPTYWERTKERATA